MRDPARIRHILQRLEAIWSRYPDWRLGQLMLNLSEETEDNLWDLEDDRMLEIIEDWLNKEPVLKNSAK